MNFIMKIIENFKTQQELENLTDRELRDIGLSRYDINSYCKLQTKEEINKMFIKIKNFIVKTVSTWQEAIAMRDKILINYKHIGS